MEPWELDPAHAPPPIIERAYQLARCGQFREVEEICHQLIRERYENVLLHFESRAATRADLLRECRLARSGLRSAPNPASLDHPQSRSQWLEFKAAECRQLAENARANDARAMYLKLAVSYERLSSPAKQSDDEPGKSEEEV